jgi:hypothetical protein
MIHSPNGGSVRYRIRLSGIAPLLATIAILAGCGNKEDPGTPPPTTGAGVSPPPAAPPGQPSGAPVAGGGVGMRINK